MGNYACCAASYNAGVELPQGKRVLHGSVLVISLLISLGFWHWTVYILAPANTATILAAHRPIGNNSDLYPRWFGARELFLHRRDPYGAEVTREIQIGFYGRPLNPGNPSDPTAQESFVYPLYAAFLLAPTVKLPFSAVAVFFRWFLLAAVAATVPLWMYAIRIPARWPIIVSGMLLATSSSPAVAEYFQQNLAALVVLFLAGAAAAIVARRLGLAGVLLALSTVKPDTSGLVVLWLLAWSITSRQRRALLWWFAGSLGLLVAAAEVCSPHWIGRFISAVRAYPSYGTDPSIIQVLFPASIAAVITFAVVLYVAIVCWKWRNAAAGSEYFAWAVALVGTTTLVILPKLAAYNALLLVPAFLVLISQYGTSSKDVIFSRGMIKAAFACQLWQWLAAGLLSLASLVLPPVWIRTAAHVPDYTSLALWPITLLALTVVSPRPVKN
ncbi:MAG TPA: glycosyltransferase 87 family protein [Terriglobales bacterium]|nr:glycosyltransferase 87 family protein [Terriglobales bacterium]